MKELLDMDKYTESEQTRLKKSMAQKARWAKVRDAPGDKIKVFSVQSQESPSRLSDIESRLEKIERELGLERGD